MMEFPIHLNRHSLGTQRRVCAFGEIPSKNHANSLTLSTSETREMRPMYSTFLLRIYHLALFLV